MTEVDFSYSSSAELPRAFPIPTSPNYINNLSYWNNVYANKFVSRIEFRFASFTTESWVDLLHIRELGVGAWWSMSGNVASGTWLGFASSTSLQHRPAELHFVTDFSGGMTGFNIDKARVCCKLPAGPATPFNNLSPGQRHGGLLLGTNDHVDLTVPSTPSGTNRNLMMWHSSGRNFNVYVRCNAMPTPTTFDFAGLSTDVKEFLSLAPSFCPFPGTWNIVVHSNSGSGQFHITTAAMKHEHVRSLRVGTTYLYSSFPAGASQRDFIKSALLRASALLFGATEGQMLVNQYDVWNLGCSPIPGSSCGGQICDVCITDESGQSTASFNQPPVLIKTHPNYDYEVIAHELGHYLLGLPDEYLNTMPPTTDPQQCAHSLMSQHFGSNNNFCIPSDHNRDAPKSFLSTNTQSVWTLLNGVFTNTYNFTPDNYDYATFESVIANYFEH